MCLWIFILLLAALEVEFVLKIVAAFSVLKICYCYCANSIRGLALNDEGGGV